MDYVLTGSAYLKGLGQWLECASGGTYGDNTIPSTFLGGSGVILQWNADVTGIILDNALTQAPKISGCYIRGNSKWGITSIAGSVAGTSDGIQVGSNHARIEDVFVQGWSNNGLNCDSSLSGTYNGNNLFVIHSTFYYNRGNGIRTKGNDCNNGSFYNTDTSYNQYWGILESSFLGNDYYSPHTSSNHYAAATQSAGSTKNISTIGSVSNVVTTVFSTAHSMTTGTYVVIAGVTYGGATSFNGTLGPITVVNSTTITYPQTREDSSGTGGTGRAPTYQEQWTAQGLDGGGIKQPTAQAVNRSAYFSPYTEGGQGDSAGPGNKWSSVAIIFGGKNPDADMTLSPNIIYSATAQTRMTGGLYVWNENDVNNTAFYRAGTAAGAVRHFYQSYLDNAGTGQWGIDVDPNGTSGQWILCRSTPGCASPRRLSFYGSASANGITRISSESTGAVQINLDANSGTGGLTVCSGGAVPTCPTSSSIGSDFGFFGPYFKSSTANPAAAGTVRLAKTDTIAFRNNANGADVNGVSLDGSDRLVLGGANGVTATSIPVPGPIGATTPNTGAFTTLSVTTINDGQFAGQNAPKSAYVTSAYTNATTTFSNVTALSFAVGATTNYHATCRITWQGSAGTTGPKYQFTGPAAPTAVAVGMNSVVTATTVIAASAVAFSSAVANTGTVTAATNFTDTIDIGVVNGANAGTVQLQAAANGVGTLTIQPGSYCSIQ